jgi:hypothetical protein
MCLLDRHVNGNGKANGQAGQEQTNLFHHHDQVPASLGPEHPLLAMH